MHKTSAGERRKFLKKNAMELSRNAKALQKAVKYLPAVHGEAQQLQAEAEAALVEADALKIQARLEDQTVWEIEKVKQTRKGPKTYTYWMTSWREGNKTRNVHLGSSRKMDAEEALQMAKKMKAEAIHVN
jgi:hypothetical protein